VEVIAFIILRRLQRRRERRRKKMFWIHPINMKRDALGTFKHLFPDLLKDPRKFCNYFRMSIERFYELEKMLHDYIVLCFSKHQLCSPYFGDLGPLRHIFHNYLSLELLVSRHPY
jgi:hypothetical protein